MNPYQGFLFRSYVYPNTIFRDAIKGQLHVTIPIANGYYILISNQFHCTLFNSGASHDGSTILSCKSVSSKSKSTIVLT